MGKIGPVALRVSSAVSGGLGAAAVAKFAKDSVDAAATFDKTMRQVAIAARVPAGQIKQLREVALDMGAKTSFSAKQAGDAMLALGKGGLSFAQMKAGALQATLTLAAAGELELGQAAGFVVKGLTTFGLKADKAATVAAALAGGANASTASVEDLGLALSQVGPGARNAGLSIQETTGVLAAFANSGIQGTDAGTSLKTMLTRLVPTTAAAKEAMKKLGLSFVDSHGAMLPIPEIAARIQDRFKGLTDAERTRAMATIFGSDATRAATVLMNEGRSGIEKYVKATNNRAAAEKLAKTNTEGAAGAFERLKGAIETVQIRFGSALLPTLANVATTFADKILPAVQKTAQQFARDLGPELGRVRLAWDQNRASILGFATSLETTNTAMLTTQGTASGFATTLQQLIQAGGALARFGDRVAGHLNDVDASFQETGKDVNWFLRKFAGFDVVMGPVTRWLQKVEAGDNAVATASDRAATAAQRHAGAMRSQRSALQALKGALDDEKASEIELRQAKLNVTAAQARLNTVKRAGKKGSFEYKQAQLDLERAQIDLRHKTDDYKAAQLKANAATRGAMSATQRASVAHRGFVRAAGDAGRAGRRFGDQVRDGILRIPKGRTIVVRARAAVEIAQSTRMYLKAANVAGFHHFGGPVTRGVRSRDSALAMLRRDEHVWTPEEVDAVGGHGAMYRMRKDARSGRFRGYADGGEVQHFQAGGSVGLRFAAENRIRDLSRWHGAMVTATDRLGERLVDRLAASIGRGLSKAIEQSMGALGGLSGPGGWRWQMAVLRRVFPNVQLISGFRPGARTRSGSVSYHARGRAVDVSPRMDVFNWIRANYGAKTRELIFTPAGRRQIHNGRPHVYSAGIASDHWNHVHWAYRHGGRVFDEGGILPPGRTLAVNRTGQGELVMPAAKLGGVFRDALRSWVVPWLRRIAVGVEGGGGGGARAASRAGGSAARASRGGRLTARQLSSLSDAARWAYVDKYGRPPAPPGYVWAEDHTIVPRSFYNRTSYDTGGWLMPGTTLATNRTGRPERILPPGDRGGVLTVADARLIAAELAKVIPTRVAVDDIHAGLLTKRRRVGGANLGLS